MENGTREKLLQNLERDDLTIEELVTSAEGLLEVLAPTQTKYKVTERPDVRTIRYYTSQALLPKPVGYTGGRARYSGSHLIRLLLIKKMQAEHHTLAQIKRVMREANDEAVLDNLIPSLPPTLPTVTPARRTTGSYFQGHRRTDMAERLERMAAELVQLAKELRAGEDGSNE